MCTLGLKKPSHRCLGNSSEGACSRYWLFWEKKLTVELGLHLWNVHNIWVGAASYLTTSTNLRGGSIWCSSSKQQSVIVLLETSHLWQSSFKVPNNSSPASEQMMAILNCSKIGQWVFAEPDQMWQQYSITFVKFKLDLSSFHRSIAR